ncbi:MAG: DNA-binding protein [Candidatus Diapherotrites archaeon]|nr:DNA-binding protein [Candidatus Diapherotrites archaeon]MDZ4256548.1 DNA-binding protein [archaeon]
MSEEGMENQDEMMRARAQKRYEEIENQRRMEGELDQMLASLLTPDAKTRLNNVRLVNKEKYLQVAHTLIMAARQGKLPSKIDEDQVKRLLAQITPPKKEFTIKRK